MDNFGFYDTVNMRKHAMSNSGVKEKQVKLKNIIKSKYDGETPRRRLYESHCCCPVVKTDVLKAEAEAVLEF